jgi:plasmid stability protein
MAQILVRNLDEETLASLKARARNSGRSLQGEAKLILETASAMSMRQARTAAARWQRRLAGRIGGDSAALIRKGRSR